MVAGPDASSATGSAFLNALPHFDAALAGLIRRLTGEQITRLRIVMLANNEMVIRKWNGAGHRTKVQGSPPPPKTAFP